MHACHRRIHPRRYALPLAVAMEGGVEATVESGLAEAACAAARWGRPPGTDLPAMGLNPSAPRPPLVAPAGRCLRPRRHRGPPALVVAAWAGHEVRKGER